MKKFMAWTLPESAAFGIAILAFVYVGTKIWLRHQVTSPVIPAVGITSALWFFAQMVEKPALKRIAWVFVLISVALTALFAFRYFSLHG
jgi:predicted exporter